MIVKVVLAFLLGAATFLAIRATWPIERKEPPLAARPVAEMPRRAEILASGDVASATPHKIIVYYFHGSARCMTCLGIEAYTRRAIQEPFADELRNGRMEWRPVNTDLDEDAHYKKDYNLSKQAVVLVDIQDQRQVRWKNLEKVWDLYLNEEAFVKYVREEVLAFMHAQ